MNKSRLFYNHGFMGNLSDNEKQKRYFRDRELARENRGRLRRPPFHAFGLIQVIFGIAISLLGLFCIFLISIPNVSGRTIFGYGIGLLILGILLTLIADRFGRRKF